MDFVYIADTPNNCFPSMHVALTSVSTWSLRGYAPRYFKLFMLWTLAIILSTLTTKQHYFVDILGGLGVLVVVVALEKKGFFQYLNHFSKSSKNAKGSEFTKVF
jgi:membrane-associated phospholipid phosphatase